MHIPRRYLKKRGVMPVFHNGVLVPEPIKNKPGRWVVIWTGLDRGRIGRAATNPKVPLSYAEAAADRTLLISRGGPAKLLKLVRLFSKLEVASRNKAHTLRVQANILQWASRDEPFVARRALLEQAARMRAVASAHWSIADHTKVQRTLQANALAGPAHKRKKDSGESFLTSCPMPSWFRRTAFQYPNPREVDQALKVLSDRTRELDSQLVEVTRLVKELRADYRK